MNLTDIRRTVIAALFSDDVLFRRLVLKGGSALELVHKIVSRGSIDVDLSIADAFEDVQDTQKRVFDALHSAFSVHKIAVFDETFEVVPPIHGIDLLPWWGGYKSRIQDNRCCKF